jgi:hypothetical protein
MNKLDVWSWLGKHVLVFFAIGRPFVIGIVNGQRFFPRRLKATNKSRHHAIWIRILVRRQSIASGSIRITVLSRRRNSLDCHMLKEGRLRFHFLEYFLFLDHVSGSASSFVLRYKLNEFPIVGRKDVMNPRQEWIGVGILIDWPIFLQFGTRRHFRIVD